METNYEFNSDNFEEIMRRIQNEEANQFVGENSIGNNPVENNSVENNAFFENDNFCRFSEF